MDNSIDKTPKNEDFEINDYKKKFVSEMMKSLKPGEVIVCSFGQGGGKITTHRYFKDKYFAPSLKKAKTEEEKQTEERLRSGSWNISNHFDSQRESPSWIGSFFSEHKKEKFDGLVCGTITYEDQPKITKEQFDQLKTRLNSQKTEDVTISRIESFVKKVYENRKSFQLEEWVKGNPIHNAIDDECCPDFSCCQPGLLRSESERIEYASLDDNCRENWRKLFGLRAIIACVNKEVKK